MTPHEAIGVTETRVVHEVHRRASTLLADLARRPTPGAATFRDFVVVTLEHHHTAEDTDLWPMLIERDPALSDDLVRLTREHDQLQRHLDTLATVEVDPGSTDLDAATSVRDLVADHLGHEEPILFPAIDRCLSNEEWDEFSKRTVASSPQAGLELLVALVHEVGTPDDAALLFRHVPAEAQAILPTLREAGDEALARLRAAEHDDGATR